MTAVLEREGETIHPASEWLASESAHFASEACGHDLHCFQALRSMDEILVANFMLFQEVVEEGMYDLVVGDEAWDVDHFWHENPELKRGAHVWLTDFVGYLPMPDGGDHEAFLTADYNAEMIEHIANFPRIRDRSIFVGNPDDVVPDTFGPGLPTIRDWTEAHFDFSGYITGFSPPTADEVAEWRAELGLPRRRADLRRHRRRLRRRPRPAGEGDRRPPDRPPPPPRAAHDRRRRAAHRPRVLPRHPASRCTATSTGSTATSPCATWPSCRAG